MRLTTATPEALEQSVPLVAVLLARGRVGGLPGELGKRAAAVAKAPVFAGKSGETFVLHAETRRGPRALLLVGLGEKNDLGVDAFRRAGLKVGECAAGLGADRVVVSAGGKVAFDGDALDAAATGCVLSGYRYALKKAETKPPREVAFVSEVKGAAARLRRAGAVAEAANRARDLGDLPGNVATPDHFKTTAAEICRKGKLRFKAYDKRALQRMKMGGILAVNQGSANPPWLLEMEYAPSRWTETVCVVGKGLTFDSGGISIKPSARMEEMKYDMCGAAATLGVMQAVAATKPKGVRVVGIVGTTDNMPDGNAYKPGDVVTTASGKTIEVINTDAEGRVVLADALHHATSFEPDAIIDMATLTGAIVVSLGEEAAGLFCKHDRLRERIVAAAERTGEAVWPMPTYDAYSESIKSSFGDIKNSAGREGGSCTAAAFLFEFTGDVPHAHVDIAGTAWHTKPHGGLPAGATGFGVRLVHDVIAHW